MSPPLDLVMVGTGGGEGHCFMYKLTDLFIFGRKLLCFMLNVMII